MAEALGVFTRAGIAEDGEEKDVPSSNLASALSPNPQWPLARLTPSPSPAIGGYSQTPALQEDTKAVYVTHFER